MQVSEKRVEKMTCEGVEDLYLLKQVIRYRGNKETKWQIKSMSIETRYPKFG